MRRMWFAHVALVALVALAVLAWAPAFALAAPPAEAATHGEGEPSFPAPATTATQEPQHAAAQEPEHAPAQDPEHAAAQEHEEEHADEEHAAEPKEWFYWPAKWINFLALAGLLYWMLVIPPAAVQDIFSFPGLRAVFAQRGQAILAARDLAAEQKHEAARLLADSEQRLAKIDDELAALATDARQDAEREQARALQDGRAQAEKIREVAERELRNQRVAAQRQLRGFVADLAVNMARQSLAEHLTADDQDRLIREYLSRLGPSLGEQPTGS